MPRLSRPCWDKPHRCPGWAGGGWKFAKRTRCHSGYITYGMDYDTLCHYDGEYPPHWWSLGRCTKCDVIVLPYWTRKLDPRYHWGRVQSWWMNHRY